MAAQRCLLGHYSLLCVVLCTSARWLTVIAQSAQHSDADAEPTEASVPCDVYLRAVTIQNVGLTNPTAPVTATCTDSRGFSTNVALNQAEILHQDDKSAQYYTRLAVGQILDNMNITCRINVGYDVVVPGRFNACYFQYEDFYKGGMAPLGCRVPSGSYVLQCLYNTAAAIAQYTASAGEQPSMVRVHKPRTHASLWQDHRRSRLYLIAGGVSLVVALTMFAITLMSGNQSPIRQWSLTLQDLEMPEVEQRRPPDFFEAISPNRSRKLRAYSHPVIILTPSSSSANFYVGIPEGVSTCQQEPEAFSDGSGSDTESSDDSASTACDSTCGSPRAPLLSHGPSSPTTRHRRSFATVVDDALRAPQGNHGEAVAARPRRRPTLLTRILRCRSFGSLEEIQQDVAVMAEEGAAGPASNPGSRVATTDELLERPRTAGSVTSL